MLRLDLGYDLGVIKEEISWNMCLGKANSEVMNELRFNYK